MSFTEKHLPAPILLALAKNDSTPADIRREIIELMIERNYKEVNDQDLRYLVAEIKEQRQAKKELHEIIENAVEDHYEGPFKAGFTTGDMQQDEILKFQDEGNPND